ncbi:hypothetical protein [Dictyobacter aurantiacus]|uniref:Uncharacterized protein n=1 Tax=Dictyobacter aurantiacus TaxID=1936993 RepID=A0A401ZR95_9CHLR|nr:hypothetical protein [Dictyobacter aurantiacus]GCE09383.1 hypothetical protein KDAU_67120 [Dictyobacter aurantiacus]
MNPYVKAVEEYKSLKPELFPFLLRIEIHEQYSYDIFEVEPVLDAWFYENGRIEELTRVFHMRFYGMNFSPLRISSRQPQHLDVISLHEWHWEDFVFEVYPRDADGKPYAESFYCRRFDARIINACV